MALKPSNKQTKQQTNKQTNKSSSSLSIAATETKFLLEIIGSNETKLGRKTSTLYTT
jgi:hypothetical protein